MIETCCSCGEDFLTEADPYVVRPTPKGIKLYCSCQIVGHSQSNESEIKKLREERDKLVDCVKFYANEESWCSDDGVFFMEAFNDEERVGACVLSGKLARQTLKDIGEV